MKGNFSRKFDFGISLALVVGASILMTPPYPISANAIGFFLIISGGFRIADFLIWLL